MLWLKNFFNRAKLIAFSIHLGLSLIIFSIILYFILVHWYPQPLFATDGGWQGIRLIAFVDIVLGPLLTLVVYRAGKPGLKLDLSMIAGLQLLALTSGAWLVYGEHPVALVIVDGFIKPITADQAEEAGISVSSLSQYSQFTPPLVYIDLPADINAKLQLRAKIINEGYSLITYGKLYQSLSDENKHKVRISAMLVDHYIKDKPADVATYNQFLRENKFPGVNLMFFPLLSRYEPGVAVMNADTLEIIDVLKIRPPAMI